MIEMPYWLVGVISTVLGVVVFSGFGWIFYQLLVVDPQREREEASDTEGYSTK